MISADDAGSISRYPPPVNEDKVDKKCWNFTIGNKKIKEFYSPNYPNNYFNQTYCTFVLEGRSCNVYIEHLMRH